MNETVPELTLERAEPSAPVVSSLCFGSLATRRSTMRRCAAFFAPV